jgi:hypothetical protein
MPCNTPYVKKKREPQNHGYSDTPTYKVWVGIKKRCYNPKAENYYLYGGRGIVMSQEWHCFLSFLADMGERPSSDHSIERINHEGSYCKENCRWATKLEQARNKRNNRLIEAFGEIKCMSEWLEILGVSHSTIRDRVYKLGWTYTEAIETPVAKRNWKAKSICASGNVSSQRFPRTHHHDSH